MKQWNNPGSQPSGNRMNPWHTQLMPPPIQGAPSGYHCSCPQLRPNMNVYLQDQRRVSMPTHPGIQSHVHHQQNIRMTMTHQQRLYQQPLEHGQSVYQQGRIGHECRNVHYSTHPPTPQYSMPPPYHQHQHQYPMGQQGMMLPLQPQFHQPPANIYSLPIQPPSFHCQAGGFSRHPPIHHSMVTPNCYSTFSGTYSQRRGPQQPQVSSTAEEHHFRHALSVNHGKNMVKSPSAKVQNVRHVSDMKQSRGLGVDNAGDSVSKGFSSAKKNSRTVKEAGLSCSSAVVSTSTDESAKVTDLCQSEVVIGDESGANCVANLEAGFVVDGSSGGAREALTKSSVTGKVVEITEVCGIGDESRVKKEKRLSADDDEDACDSVVFNLDHKKKKSEKRAIVDDFSTKQNPFLKASCQKSLGVIFETETDREVDMLGTGSETSSEKSSSQLGKLKVMSILEKVAEELKINDDILNYRRVEITAEKTRVSRAVSREPRLKEIRNKWNIADKFGNRKSRGNSRRNSHRRAASDDSETIPPLTLIPSQCLTGKCKAELVLGNGTSSKTVAVAERRPSTERGYEYDINIDDMVNNICHSSTPSFTSSDDGHSPEKVDQEVLECGNEHFLIKAFEEDEHYSTIKGYSDDVRSGFLVKEHSCSSSEFAVTGGDGYDVGVESIRVAFKNLSASITAIKERLEGDGSEPQKLIMETEASFLKFQKSYLKAKTAFQEDIFKYPSDIHYDELTCDNVSSFFGHLVHGDYEIIIDYKNGLRQDTKTHQKNTGYNFTSNSFEEFTDTSLTHESNLNIDGISYDQDSLLNYNYFGQFNINNLTSRFESRSLFGVTLGTMQYLNNNEQRFSANQIPHENNNQFHPHQQFSSHPSVASEKNLQDLLEDIDPNTIDFNTSDMRDDTISASSCESAIRVRTEVKQSKKLLKGNTLKPAKVIPCNEDEENENVPRNYLRPGVYPGTPELISESFDEPKEDAQGTLGRLETSKAGFKEKCTVKKKPFDRGSYLQPGIKQKSLVEIMKNSGGVDKSVPFSIKQLEIRHLEASRTKNEDESIKTTEKSSKKCENWLSESLKPANERKRIPSLFEVKVSGVFNTKSKADKRKQSNSSYGSGDAPCLLRRNVSTSRNGSRPGSKKLTRRHKAASRGQTRRKEDSAKEVVKEQVVSPGQQWWAIAPGMYRNVNTEKLESVGLGSDVLDSVNEVEEGMRVINRHKETPPPLSKILAIARKSNEGNIV